MKEGNKMRNTFYVSEPSEGLYNLRLVRNHECIHVGRDLDKVMEIIRKYIIKFKGDPEKLIKRIRKTNYGKGTMMSKEGRMRLEKEYAENKDRYSELVYRTVDTCMKEIKPSGPKKNKTHIATNKTVKLKAGIPAPKQEKTPEITNMKQKPASRVKHKVSTTAI